MRPPASVPIATQTAKLKMNIAQRPSIDLSGDPTKTGMVSSNERPKGKIRRGGGRDAIAAATHTKNAIRAAKGRTNITEKSTTPDIKVVVHLPPNYWTTLHGSVLRKSRQAAFAPFDLQADVRLTTPCRHQAPVILGPELVIDIGLEDIHR